MYCHYFLTTDFSKYEPFLKPGRIDKMIKNRALGKTAVLVVNLYGFGFVLGQCYYCLNSIIDQTKVMESYY